MSPGIVGAQHGRTRGGGSRGPRRAWLEVAALLLIAAGLGAYTFDYAEGASYLSSDPSACVNCHIMQPQYDSWERASHRAVAGCVDCHLPAEGLGKWIAKASNGYHHSKAFTLQDFAEPIRITRRNAEILQDNCLRCHGPLLHDQVAGVTTADDALSCVHCHATVGHGPRAALGGTDRGVQAALERLGLSPPGHGPVSTEKP